MKRELAVIGDFCRVRWPGASIGRSESAPMRVDPDKWANAKPRMVDELRPIRSGLLIHYNLSQFNTFQLAAVGEAEGVEGRPI